MGKKSIPYALDMRRLKYGDATDAERAAATRALRAADRHAEVILLYERHPDHPELLEEVDWAVKHGQAFALLSIHRVGGPVTDDHLRKCAEVALREGRAMDARNCYLALGDEAAVAAIADQLPASLRGASSEAAAEEAADEDGSDDA